MYEIESLRGSTGGGDFGILINKEETHFET